MRTNEGKCRLYCNGDKSSYEVSNTLPLLIIAQLTNIVCANTFVLKNAILIQVFKLVSSFIFSEPQNLLFFKISRDHIEILSVHCYNGRLYLYIRAHPEYLFFIQSLGISFSGHLQTFIILG